MAVSTLAIISVAGMLVGVTAKFSPLLSRVVSASLSVLEDRLMSQFVFSTFGVEVDSLAAFCSRRSFSNFCFCRSLVLLKTRWMLVLICSCRAGNLGITTVLKTSMSHRKR